ncbi:TRAP transporter small permease [Hoeflea alexandrii]|uniref:TRAP transporter small permease n=1 Tax=Hoeflea alexandrii TaxID=288436 RepID=UPI0022B06F5D|nr:TRAP transporter small permease [Hoeflea alexandrii]MCZ4287716.1 TRAP transporter small permease [Hoeflea alexandrii]
MFSKLTGYFAIVASALFVAIGVMISYEVVMRYVFLAPTSWTEEMARFFLIWAVYMSAAHLLHKRELISITVIQDKMSPRWRLASEFLTLIWIAAFSVVAVYYGVVTVNESVQIGRKTASMLSVPQWLTEISIPIGFALLFIQCLVEAQGVLRDGHLKGNVDRNWEDTI